MRDGTFPKPIPEILATLADIFRHQGQTEIVELLESAHARIDLVDYDNWNGGTYSWALRLEVPVSVFASVESRLPDIEKAIVSKLAHICKPYQNHSLGEITITPLIATSSAVGQRMAPSNIDVHRLWTDGFFRLFLSHVAKHKIAVSNLKGELRLRGVDAFVAHEDIEPSLEWQREIELALQSMHALAALITADFHASTWTDHEVGWALGRGLLVVPVRLETNPYGLAGKLQALSGDLNQPKELADSIVETLLKNPQTHGEMRRAMVSSFLNSSSYAMTRALFRHIIKIDDFTNEEKDQLRTACQENNQVSNVDYVPARIFSKFGNPSAANEISDGNVPF